MKYKKLKKLKNFEWFDLVNVLPYKEVLDVLEVEFGKRERKNLEEYMQGQTVSVMSEQTGIYVCDLSRFMSYRKQKLAAKDMPLDD